MDSKLIFDYIYMLETTNKELIDNNTKLTSRNNELLEELADFKKVSIMVNINKQLKEKENHINLLENEIRNLKNKLNNSNNILVVNKTINNKEPILLNNLNDVILETNAIINNNSNNISNIILDSEIDINQLDTVKTSLIDEPFVESIIKEPELVELETKKKKKSKIKECQVIKYKNIEYLLNVETNEIYELDDKKLNNQIGILSKGKIKFNKT